MDLCLLGSKKMFPPPPPPQTLVLRATHAYGVDFSKWPSLLTPTQAPKQTAGGIHHDLPSKIIFKHEYLLVGILTSWNDATFLRVIIVDDNVLPYTQDSDTFFRKQMGQLHPSFKTRNVTWPSWPSTRTCLPGREATSEDGSATPASADEWPDISTNHRQARIVLKWHTRWLRMANGNGYRVRLSDCRLPLLMWGCDVTPSRTRRRPSRSRALCNT